METTGFPGLAFRTNQGTNALPWGSAEFSRWSYILIFIIRAFLIIIIFFFPARSIPFRGWRNHVSRIIVWSLAFGSHAGDYAAS